MSIFQKRDEGVKPMTIVPTGPAVAVAPPRRMINPLIPMCFLGIILFLIASAIVISLIPVYLKTRNIEQSNVQSSRFTMNMALRNGFLPAGSLSSENCAAIQDELRQQARASNNVNPSVPSIDSCTVTGNSTTTTRRKKRQTAAIGNLIVIVVILTPGNCLSNACSLSRGNAFVNLVLNLGQLTLNLVQADGTRFNFICAFISSSAITLIPTPPSSPGSSGSSGSSTSSGTSSGTSLTSTTMSTTTTTTSSTNPNLTFYAINDQNQLLKFNAQNPGTVISTVNIVLVNATDTLIDIDFRPASGDLYGTSKTRLYRINVDTGIAHGVGAAIDTATYGNIVTMENNAFSDKLVYLTDTGGYLRIDPETGLRQANTTITNALNTSISYDNNFSGAAATTLFLINPTMDFLLSRTSLINPVPDQIGSGLGVNITAVFGFDVAPNGFALACVQINNTRQLYLVNLQNGTLSKNLGVISQPIVSLAIPTAPVAYAILSNNNSLLYANTIDSNIQFISKPLTGLQPDEVILGMDMRTLNGALYGVGNTSRLYHIDMGTATATAVGSGPFTPALLGTAFGFDFIPTFDLIRVISNLGQNMRLDPTTGLAIFQGFISRPSGTPTVTGIAFSNNSVDATETFLYDIDSSINHLYTQLSPLQNDTIVDIGPLGITIDNNNGFDISGRTGTALGLFTVSGVTDVYQINLGTGAATKVPNSTYPAAIRAFTVGMNV